MQTNQNNIMTAKLHLACPKPDKTANPNLQNILFEDGFAIACNGNVFFAIDLAPIFEKKLIDFLHNKLIKATDFEKIVGCEWGFIDSFPLKLYGHDKTGSIEVELIHLSSTIKDGSELVVNYPNWKSAIPHLNGIEATSRMAFKAEIKFFKLINDVMFSGPVKESAVMVLCYEMKDREFIRITPYVGSLGKSFAGIFQ